MASLLIDVQFAVDTVLLQSGIEFRGVSDRNGLVLGCVEDERRGSLFGDSFFRWTADPPGRRCRNDLLPADCGGTPCR